METLYTRRKSHLYVNIICVPEYFCHPVLFRLEHWWGPILVHSQTYRSLFKIEFETKSLLNYQNISRRLVGTIKHGSDHEVVVVTQQLQINLRQLEPLQPCQS